MLKSIESFIQVRKLQGIRASVSDLCGARSQSRWQILDVSKTQYFFCVLKCSKLLGSLLKSIESFIKVRKLRGIRASVSDLCGARSQSRWQILGVSKNPIFFRDLQYSKLLGFRAKIDRKLHKPRITRENQEKPGKTMKH